MSYLSLGVSLALTVFLAIHVVASLLVVLVWRAARRDLDAVSARARAGGLFLLRVFPTAAAWVIVLGVLVPAFWRFEPRESGEIVGPTLTTSALAAAGLILGGLCRAWRASAATRRVVREWLRDARPLALPGVRIRAFAIRADFPVVSLVGIVRPRLFVSERVLAACTAEELAVMVRHEAAHLASRDNLKRLAFGLCPNALPRRGAELGLERDWEEACEEAADDAAARASTPSALALANALVRVARMAPGCGAVTAPAATLYAGGSIERRVKRLVSEGAARRSRTAWLVVVRALAAAPAVVALAVLCNSSLLRLVHRAIEVVVETLP